MNNKTKTKLLDYEVRPPEGIWGKIVASIEKNPTLKLQRFEIKPSIALWSRIREVLDRQEVVNKPIPFYQRYTKPLHYSGAMAAFIIVTLVVTLLLGKRTKSETAPSLNFQNQESNLAGGASDSSVAFNKTPPMALVPFSRKSSPFRHIATEQMDFLAKLKKGFPAKALASRAHADGLYAAHYLIFSDDSGKALRLPKKLYEIFAAMPTNQNLQMEVRKLQERAASIALTSDFTGVLDILNNLSQNQ
ncbi:MAG: hypothetical protein NVS1B13_23110 [Flavisolibacter sp.]